MNRKHSLRLSLLLFTLVISRNLSAQEINQMPQVIPPAPSTQAFMRYGEIPMNPSTGVPIISIPIFSIKGRQLELPISISYHASGIKVNDISSEVGLGWVLKAGGLVSRTVLGRPDEKTNHKKTFSNATHLLDSVRSAANVPYDWNCNCLPGMYSLEYWFSVQNGFDLNDPMSDRFFFTLPSDESGVFRYDFEDKSNVVLLPNSSVKINPKFNTNKFEFDTKIIGFNIIDAEGISYSFESFIPNNVQTFSEWYLTQIISADKSDTIHLDYYTFPDNPMWRESSFMLVEDIDQAKSVKPAVSDRYSHLNSSVSPSNILNTPVLKSIRSAISHVSFVYKMDRLDFEQLPRLAEIVINSEHKGSVEKHVFFHHKHFGTNSADRRLQLDKLTFSTDDPRDDYSYSFLYEASHLPPYPQKMQSPKYYVDFWGYCNGPVGSPTTIPVDFITKSTDKWAGANRDPELNGIYAKSCMLNRIIYPTGGSTSFTFERNRAENVFPEKSSYNGVVGGFRISRLANYDNDGILIGQKTYKYENPVFRPIDESFFVSKQYYVELGKENTSRDIVYSDPFLPLEVGPGLPISYSKVTEYIGTNSGNAGKIEYFYSAPYSASDYANHEHPFEFEHPSFYHPFNFDKGNYVPVLLSKKIYSLVEDDYKMVSEVINSYSTLFSKDYQTGIKLSRPLIYNDKEAYFQFVPDFGLLTNLSPLISEFIGSFVAVDTKGLQEAKLLTNSETRMFNAEGSTIKDLVTTYTYNEKNLRVLSEISRDSKGDNVIKTYKYPFDYSGVVFQNMVSRNIISPVVEVSTFLDDKEVTKIKTNYSFWNPKQDNESLASGSLSVESSVNSTFTKSFRTVVESQLSVSLNMDICNGHFMFEVSGPSSFREFFYGTGNGNGSECIGYDSKFFSISKALLPGEYSVTLTFFPAPGFYNVGYYCSANFNARRLGKSVVLDAIASASPYIKPVSVEIQNAGYPNETVIEYNNFDVYGNVVSAGKTNGINEVYLWSYSGTFPVAKIINAEYKEIEAILGGYGAIKDLYNLKNPSLQEIKSYLNPLLSDQTGKTTEISLFTYDPLIGMTSETDANGNTTYYEYDGFGRLKYIKDNDRNILKQYDYHYHNE